MYNDQPSNRIFPKLARIFREQHLPKLLLMRTKKYLRERGQPADTCPKEYA